MDKNEVIVSIVTVVFNDVTNIEKTIRSVVNQSFEFYEYIIIDGGSTDGTMEIVESYASKIAHFISQPDKGIYDAMNKSLNYVSGKYVYFLNSGDIMHSNNTLSVIAAQAKDEDIIYCDTIVTIDDSQYRLPFRSLSVADPMPFCHQSVLVKSNLLHQFRFDTNFKICADKDFFKKCFDNGASYKSISLPFGVIKGDGFSVQNRILHMKENQAIFKESSLVYFFKLTKQYLLILVSALISDKIYSKLRKATYKNKS